MAHLAIEHPRRTAVHVAVLAACVGLLAYQLRAVEFGSLFSTVRPVWLILAVAGFAVSMGAAAHNISAFAPLRLRAVDTMRAQLAIGGLRVIAPAAVSTPAIGTRFLVRKGLPTSTAVTVLAVAQSAQLIMTIVVVGGIALLASTELPTPSPAVLLIGAVVVAALAGIAIVARRMPVVARTVTGAKTSVLTIGAHLRHHPARVASGLGASGLLTLTHIGAFVCCVHAVGGHASLIAMTAVYLGAASAGSLVPTPGGVGAVESALISGLIAAGLAPQTAAAAAVLSRLVTVWLPAIPGLVALRGLRRDGLL